VQPALEFGGNDALVVQAGRFVGSQPHYRRAHDGRLEEPLTGGARYRVAACL
jgi:hypothetical protein